MEDLNTGFALYFRIWCFCVLILMNKYLLPMMSLKWTPLILTNLLILVIWQMTEKQYNFQRFFYFPCKCDCNSIGEFDKLELHNKSGLSPEVQPTSKACFRQKLSSQHRKAEMITRGKWICWVWAEKIHIHLWQDVCFTKQVTHCQYNDWLPWESTKRYTTERGK